MKKFSFIIIYFLFINNIKAIENITINDQPLIPYFDKETFVYNYYTDNNEVNIEVIENENNVKSYDYYLYNDDNLVEIDKYKINVYKNYNSDKVDESYIKSLTIKNYDINFDKNKYEYQITIGDESNLDIEYELSNYNDKLIIKGNGNFNRSDNIIKVILYDKEYTIHAYKTVQVSKIIENNNIKEMSKSKKEIVKILIVTISCLIVLGFSYILFIDKRTISI